MIDPFIVHCHIPKTGGSALNRRVLFPTHGEENVYQLYRYVFERASRLPRRHVARAMRSDLAVGHVPFGYFDEIYPGALHVSVFREPVARFVSFLNFVLANPKHAVRARLDPPLVANAADDPDALIRAVLAEPRLAVVHRNVQTRLAGGAPRLGDVEVSTCHLEAALRNVARERYVTGVQENLDDLIDRLRERLPHLRLRTTATADQEKRLPKVLHIPALSRQTLDRIRAANDLDLRLHAAVRETLAISYAEAA